jgi:NAD(P)-dependent dehydrogenase (short-subunit alcohol dehydrogenase family)
MAQKISGSCEGATMRDKVIIVTGATNGIGQVCALELARQGATVVLISRSQSRLDTVVSEIKAATGNENLSSIQADLSSIAEIRRAASQFLEQHSRLDVLVNNAGAIFDKRQESADGIEMTLALNHLNYFLLTHLLLDKLKETSTKHSEARIINVASDAHESVSRVNFEDIQRRKSYNGLFVYSESKLMNIMFTHELARRLKGTKVSANVLHPGLVKTGFGRNNLGIFKTAVSLFQDFFGISAEKGAETMIFLASSPDVRGITGQYWFKSEPHRASKAAYDEAAQARLWTVSEELLGLTAKV